VQCGARGSGADSHVRGASGSTDRGKTDHRSERIDAHGRADRATRYRHACDQQECHDTCEPYA
jgi:hypothetical protein